MPNAASGTQSTLPIQKLWVGVNVLGFAISTILLIRVAVSISATPGMMGGLWALYASGIVVGSFVGALQAWVLKRQISRLRVGRWMLMSILGSYLGFPEKI